MSMSVYMLLEKRNKEGKWERINPLIPSYDNPKELVSADFDFGNGSHSIYEQLGLERGDSEMKAIHRGFPGFDASLESKSEWTNWYSEIPNIICTVINLADLHLHIIAHPETWDYEEDAKVPNPLIYVYERAKAWVSLWTNYWQDWCESDVRIISWCC